MKKCLVWSFLLLSAVFTGEAKSEIVFWDNFTYADGELPSPWQLHSGAGGQTIVNNQLFINDVGTGDYNRAIASTSTGWLYAGFDLSVSSADLPSAGTGQYFAHFGQEPSGTNANFVSRVFLATGTGGSAFNIGIARGSGTGATTTFLTGTFSADTTYRIVHGYNLDTNTAMLAVNSIDGSSGVTSTTGTTDPASVNLFAFRISGSSDGDKTIDNLVVATSYSEAFTAVPEPTSFAALVLAGLCIGARHRRR
jgi:hypothetical protein